MAEPYIRPFQDAFVPLLARVVCQNLPGFFQGIEAWKTSGRSKRLERWHAP